MFTKIGTDVRTFLLACSVAIGAGADLSANEFLPSIFYVIDANDSRDSEIAHQEVAIGAAADAVNGESAGEFWNPYVAARATEPNDLAAAAKEPIEKATNKTIGAEHERSDDGFTSLSQPKEFRITRGPGALNGSREADFEKSSLRREFPSQVDEHVSDVEMGADVEPRGDLEAELDRVERDSNLDDVDSHPFEITPIVDETEGESIFESPIDESFHDPIEDVESEIPSFEFESPIVAEPTATADDFDAAAPVAVESKSTTTESILLRQPTIKVRSARPAPAQSRMMVPTTPDLGVQDHETRDHETRDLKTLAPKTLVPKKKAAPKSTTHRSRPARSADAQPRSTRLSPAVSRRAHQLTEQGVQWANRGASYSAREQFLRTLDLVAQSMDAETGTRFYTRSLAQGLQTLEEAKDFVPRQVSGQIDVKTIIDAHQTPVLKTTDASNLSTLRAMQAYHTYAERRLADACGNHPAASKALLALAKLQPYLNGSEMRELNVPRAMSLYQTALLVDRQNSLAANELGVLFAQFGQFEYARDVLQHCVEVDAHNVAGWKNLADVHARLGEHELANAAKTEMALAQRVRPESVAQRDKVKVAWVSPQEFSKGSERAPVNVATRSEQPAPPASQINQGMPKSKSNPRVVPSATEPSSLKGRIGNWFSSKKR